MLFLLNGGPGLPCDYLRDPLLPLVEAGYRVVTYDQLGTGDSDKPKDKSLWTIGRYVEEVETVRQALGLGRIHLLGHSWGGWLGIEYALTYPKALKSLILSNTCGDMPHLIERAGAPRAALGPETVAMMQRHEAEGTLQASGLQGRHHHPQLPPRLSGSRVAGAGATPRSKRWNMDDLRHDAGAERVPLYRQPQGLEPHSGHARDRGADADRCAASMTS